MKLKIDLIIFDFDGVIVDSGRDIANAVNYSLKHFGKAELPVDEIIGFVGHGAEYLIRQCFKETNDDYVKKAEAFYKEFYLGHCVEETKLYANIAETLEYFKSKKKAVVTNKPEKITNMILKKLGIDNYFNLIVGPESVKELKPDPEGLFKVLKTLDTVPSKAIMIGDSDTDIEVGKKAGLSTCGVTYGLGDKNRLISSSPDFLIDDMGKLTGIME